MQQFIFGHLEPDDIEHASTMLGEETAHSLSSLFRVARMGFSVLQAIEEVLERHDLTPARFRILMVLAFHPAGASSTTALAEVLDVAPASVSGMLRTLEEHGWVERVPSQEDRRRVEIRLTERGEHAVREAVPDVAELGTLSLAGSRADGEADGFLRRCDEVHQQLGGKS